jgi:hypothetical protein
LRFWLWRNSAILRQFLDDENIRRPDIDDCYPPQFGPLRFVNTRLIVVRALGPSLITLFGQWRERRARREELILSEAAKLAQAQMDILLRMAAAANSPVEFRPLVQLTGHYYEHLKRLMETGKYAPIYIQIRKPKDR